jgi:hypothetical protein
MVLCLGRERYYLNENSFGGSFLLGTWRSNQRGAFLLSEVELIRFGSIVAYLDIN